MPNEDRFKQPVVTALAKRAANCCSNPDCRAITSGPTDHPMGAINVGEAAHIYGANAGSARYDLDMASLDRSAITNAIWLCSNCHKMVDDDEQRFPAGLLFEWQRDHDRWVSEQVGKAGAGLRRRYEERHLEEFGKLSYIAERIVLEKGALWEYRLTSEVLRYELSPIAARWDALKRGLYIKPSRRVAKADFIPWMMARLHEVRGIVGACNGLMNEEFARAWGEPGIPGNDLAIVTTCRLYAETCQSIVTWEEEVRFCSIDEIFRNVQKQYIGVAGRILEEALKVTSFMADTLSAEGLSGPQILSLTIDLPEGWAEETERELEIATAAYIADMTE